MYKLILGDCIEQMNFLPENSIDVVVTSPPYNLDIKYNLYNDNLDYNKYLDWIEGVFHAINRILKSDGSLFINIGYSCKKPDIDIDVLLRSRGIFILQNRINWIKSISIGDQSYGHFKPITSSRFLNNNHESIYHLTKNGNTPIDRLSIGVPYQDKSNISRWNNKSDLRCRGNNWFIPYETIQSKSKKGEHPAIFPVALAEDCIKLHGIKSNLLVLDPMVGTGSTIIAAQNLQVDSIGIDVDPKYIEYAKERIESVIKP